MIYIGNRIIELILFLLSLSPAEQAPTPIETVRPTCYETATMRCDGASR